MFDADDCRFTEAMVNTQARDARIRTISRARAAILSIGVIVVAIQIIVNAPAHTLHQMDMWFFVSCLVLWSYFDLQVNLLKTAATACEWGRESSVAPTGV